MTKKKYSAYLAELIRNFIYAAVFVYKFTRQIWATRDKNLRVLGVVAAAGDTAVRKIQQKDRRLQLRG